MILLGRYLAGSGGDSVDPGVAAFYATLDHLHTTSPLVAEAIIKEFRDQRTNLKLIASENYSSLATQLACGNLLTDKYAEGVPQHRFYAGCENVDTVEMEAAQLARNLFNAEHAYVQPHSGADANLVAFYAVLLGRIETPMLAALGNQDPTKLNAHDWATIREAFHNQRLLAMDYYSGGHLTHGYRHNVSSQLFESHYYTVDPVTHVLNLDHVRARAREVKPLILLAGYSAYSRKLNFAKLRDIADEVGAVFMVDMAHFAGLVAGKVFTGDFDPVAHAHIVTSTTHKTLRGPRGGIVLCKKEFAEFVDKGCPAVLGGPLAHAIAAKAVAFREASKPEFCDYAKRIVTNAQALAQACLGEGIPLLTGGTDNHLLLLDVAKGMQLTGRQAESALRECHITLNRNSLPFDPNGPWYTSGLRLGTPALTTVGMGPEEMKEIARIIGLVLRNITPAVIQQGDHQGEKSLAKYSLPPSVISVCHQRVDALLKQFPVYPQVDLDLLLNSGYVNR